MLLNILEVFHQKKKKKKVEEVNPLKREIPGHETQTNEKDEKYQAQDPSGFTPSGPVTYKRACVCHNSQGMTRMPYNVADK